MSNFSPSNDIATHRLLEAELITLGRLMDTHDRLLGPISAHDYRRAALRAAEILKGCRAEFNRACAHSQSLRELLENEMIAQANVSGRMHWHHTGRF